MKIQAQISKTDYENILQGMRTLEKSEESVLKTAVNNTAKKVQKLMAKKMSQRYAGEAAEKSNILKSSDIRKATTSFVKATVTFSSYIQEILDFHVIVSTAIKKMVKRMTARIRGNVLKGTAKKFDDAFVVKFKSGHVAVVSRIPGINMEKYKKKPEKPHYEKLRVWYSPSKASMAKNVYDADEISDRLHKEVEAVMEKVLGG